MTAALRRRMLKASAINGAGFLLASAAVLAWSYLLVKIYPSHQSGEILLALSVAGLLSLLDLGSSMAMVRVATPGDDQVLDYSLAEYFQSAFVIALLFEILIGSVAIFFWKKYYLPALTMSNALSILVFALSAQVNLLCTYVLKGMLDFRRSNLLSTGSTLSVYLAGAVIALAGFGVWTMLMVMAFVQLLAAFIASLLTFAALKEPWKFEGVLHFLKVYRSLLKESLPLYPQMFTGVFFAHAQRFLMVRYAGIDLVAILSFAYSVATRLHAIVNAFLEIIFPMAKQISRAGLNKFQFCLKIGGLAAAAYFVFAALAMWMTRIFMPQAVIPFLVFAIGVSFAVASAPAFHLLNGSGKSGQVSLCSILSPMVFISAAPALDFWNVLSSEILLPAAYMISMLFTLAYILVLTRGVGPTAELT